MKTYIQGSDAKTVILAKRLYSSIQAAQDAGNFPEAERLISAAVMTPNRPFRAEFAALTKAGAA